MITPRQATRRKINSIVDEMVADLHKIKRFTLNMDELAIMAIGKGLTHRFNRLIAIYKVLDKLDLPVEKVINEEKHLNLEG